MFSNEERQKERTGKYGTPRVEYLEELVTEFQQSVSEEAKEQIVAHLANFGYDPLNYGYLRQLHVLDLFLDCLTEPNEKLVEFSVGGISNCCPDPANAAVIVSSGGIPLLFSCLSSAVENTVLSAITSLYYLCGPSTRKEILIPQVIESIRVYATSEANCRFRNVATAFLKNTSMAEILACEVPSTLCPDRNVTSSTNYG